MVSPQRNLKSVSVVMSVYNGASHIKASIDSILNQSFTDFEFIIVNDGSSDETGEILSDYCHKDKRIMVIDQQNVGLTVSLNRAILSAQGKYIARQDADDISMADRLQKQFDYMQSHEDVLVLGTNYIEESETGPREGRYYPDIDKVIHKNNPFPHTSVMLRRDPFVQAGMYDESFKTSQDYEAWIRFSLLGKVAMLPDILVKRYDICGTISRNKKFSQRLSSLRARLKHPIPNKSKAILYWFLQLILAYLPKWLVRIKNKIIKKKVL